MKSKRSTTGKRGKRDRKSSGSCDYHQNLKNSDPVDVEVQRWRTNRMNYLKSRVSHIRLKSASPVNIRKSTDEQSIDGSPITSKTSIATPSPLQITESIPLYTDVIDMICLPGDVKLRVCYVKPT
ncbi:unnamed protein product [Onchocerca ochengi]|uniref:Uncharacterized protein n=1 Tax=Onchocerca ochengi TaxID=42157 RepID=A0A182EIH7_ONCOC|nr:unnamed protein product [Onchocerca ochengi]